MRLMFLGTGGYHPTEARHTACLFLPEAGLVLDAGTGLFRVFPNLMTRELDIFITHAHLDHILGLPDCHVPLKLGRLDAVRVHGTAETLDAIRDHLFAKSLFPVDTPLEYYELSESIPIPNSGTVTHFALKHPGGSAGYKVTWPKFSLAYITDTTADDSYLDFIQGVDLLIHECNFDDELKDLANQTGHSYASAVANLAKAANVKRLYFTHIDPYADPDHPIDLSRARAIFPQTEIATDRLNLKLP